MNATRRRFVTISGAATVLSGLAARKVAARAAAAGPAVAPQPADPAPGGYRPVVTPDGASLPFAVKDGVKVFHLIAEEVTHEFAPGLVGECWGYNGRVHGPTIEAVEGDHVRIYVTNRLSVSTTVHWHAVKVPAGMDGVGGLTQRPVEPGETFKYEFTLREHGTFMYHSHHDEMTQMAMGLMGMFVVHPREPEAAPPDRDFAFMLSEWKIEPGTRRPDPNEMTDFNVLTFNARIFPATQPLVVRTGEKVRIRIGNLSAMDHHPIHLHGYSFQVVATDGGTIPESARWPETTVLVPVGATRTIEFTAAVPGDWALHCHMTHHVMTQMGHGIPNLIGVDPTAFDAKLAEAVPQFTAGNAMTGAHSGSDSDVPENSLPMMGGAGPFGYITMGGMFTVLKVRDDASGDSDPGWYRHPEGSVADLASAADLERDRIEAGNAKNGAPVPPPVEQPGMGHGM